MQHRARAFGLGDRDVQARFSGWLAGPCQDMTALVDLHDLSWRQRSLVYAAARYGEPQRLTAGEGAEVPARADGPPGREAGAPALGEPARGGGGGGGGHSQGRSSNA